MSSDLSYLMVSSSYVQYFYETILRGIFFTQKICPKFHVF